MTSRDWLGELAYPFVQANVLVPMVVSWLLYSIAGFVGLFGSLLALITTVAMFRFLMTVTTARSIGRDVPTFDAEYLGFIGNGWTLMPLAVIGIVVSGSLLIREATGIDISAPANVVSRPRVSGHARTLVADALRLADAESHRCFFGSFVPPERNTCN